MFNKTMWRDLLEQNHMKCKDVAALIGTADSTISNKAGGTSEFNKLERTAIAERFQLTPEQYHNLFFYDPADEPVEPAMSVCMAQREDGLISIEAECDSVGLMQFASALLAEAIRKGMKDGRDVAFIQNDLLHIMQYAVEQMDGEHDV